MAKYDSLSRYRVDDSGQRAVRVSVPRQALYSLYVTTASDTLESIATRHLGNPLRFWEIADINPQVKFPLDLEVGTVLRLPA